MLLSATGHKVAITDAAPDTIFQAGSISKSVNAMVAMKKVEQGKISLDENINNKLTSWKLPDKSKNRFWAQRFVPSGGEGCAQARF
ncbi:MAG: serine hydrolase [Pyrinomonadaceae bacterium]